MDHSDLAKQAGYQLELKKDGLKQVQSGDVKVTFTIAQAHMENRLYSDPMGQRYVAVLVPIQDDETPRPAPPPEPEPAPSEKPPEPAEKKPKNYVAACHILLKNPDFWRFYNADNEEDTQYFFYGEMGVSSSTLIKEGSEAAKKYAVINVKFNEYLRYANQMEPSP